MVVLSDYLYGPPTPYENMEVMQEGVHLRQAMKEVPGGDDGGDVDGDSTGDGSPINEDTPNSTSDKEGSSVRQRKVGALIISKCFMLP